MGVRWGNIFWLGTKELRGLRADPVLLFLIAYAFSAAVYMMATGAKTEVENASVGIVDEDHSELSRRIALALLKPTFKPPAEPLIELGGAADFPMLLEVPRPREAFEKFPAFERAVLVVGGIGQIVDVKGHPVAEDDQQDDRAEKREGEPDRIAQDLHRLAARVGPQTAPVEEPAGGWRRLRVFGRHSRLANDLSFLSAPTPAASSR
jgi:hypothetical protein